MNEPREKGRNDRKKERYIALQKMEERAMKKGRDTERREREKGKKQWKIRNPRIKNLLWLQRTIIMSLCE